VIADARAALSKPATEQQLHWGHKYLAKYGLVEKGWDGVRLNLPRPNKHALAAEKGEYLDALIHPSP
jgi:hypothetical protein